MPYKTGKLKGKLTTAELRKLIRAHNVLVSIKIPPRTDRDGLIALIKKHGFNLDEEKGEITGKTRPRKPTITIKQAKEITKPKEKSELQKQKIKEKKQEREEKKKKDIRKIKKEAIKKEKDIQKKKDIKKDEKKKQEEYFKKLKDEKAKEKPKEKPKKKTGTISTQTETKAKRVLKLPSQEPKPVKIDKSKKPPMNTKKIIKKVKPNELKFKLPSQQPKPVKIDKDKKPPKVDKSYKIVPYKKNYPINVDLYDDIRNIPAGDVFNNLVLKREKIFYPWRSADIVADVMFYHILKDNRSTCALPRLVHSNLGDDMCSYKVKRKIIEGTGGQYTDQTIWNCKPVDALKKRSFTIAGRFIECSINGDALALPISKKGDPKGKGTHANLLLLNPLLMTAEHFEPHGGRYEGAWVNKKGGGFKPYVPPQSNLAPAIKEINEALEYEFNQYQKGGETREDMKPRMREGLKKWVDSQKGKKTIKPMKLKYENMEQTCPSKSMTNIMDGYQEGDRSSKTPSLYDGVLITEIGGYCAMWTLFHLDLRLKTLKRKSSEVYKDMIKLLDEEKKKTGNRYIELMRGMTRYAWEQLEQALKNPKYNTHGATREDFIRYMNREKGLPNNWKVSDAITTMKMDLHEKYVMADDDD